MTTVLKIIVYYIFISFLLLVFPEGKIQFYPRLPLFKCFALEITPDEHTDTVENKRNSAQLRVCAAQLPHCPNII